MPTFEIPTDPEVPAFTQDVELDGVEYRMRFEYKQRNGGWYLDLYTATGDPIVLGRRLTPEWSPMFNLFLDDGPPGILLIRGDDDYDRGDLGSDLVVVYVPESELPDLEEDTREVRL
ncbi:MAG: hypothetical protein ABEN55_12130 [Bradymonadaceae bacterium]